MRRHKHLIYAMNAFIACFAYNTFGNSKHWKMAKISSQKNAIALFAGTTLHRQYNKVAEAALSQAVVVQEEAAVRIKR